MPDKNAFYAGLVTLLLVLISTAGSAEANEQRGGRRGPPPEAIDACAALVAGDSCSFTGRRDDKITGTCHAPQDKELPWVPANRGGQHGKNRQQPPTNDSQETDTEE